MLVLELIKEEIKQKLIQLNQERYFINEEGKPLPPSEFNQFFGKSNGEPGSVSAMDFSGAAFNRFLVVKTPCSKALEIAQNMLSLGEVDA